MARSDAWPELTVDSWQPTRDTLTLWLQVVGKIRIARTPMLNHWWNAPLYLTARGLTTSLMPAGAGRSFSIDLDLLDHHLAVTTTRGETDSMRLEPMTVSDFYTRLPRTGRLPHHPRRPGDRPLRRVAQRVRPAHTAVRTADDPDAVLLEFLQRTYEAAADTAGWDRAALERQAPNT